MVFSIFFSLTVTLFIAFLSTKKKLHPFEILFMWMVVIIIYHNFITITTVNLELFGYATSAVNHWMFVFIRILLIPMLMIWYFDLTLSRTPYKKWILLPLGIVVLTGVQYLSDKFGLFHFARWKLWWSFIEWLVLFLIVNFAWQGYRNLLRKERS